MKPQYDHSIISTVMSFLKYYSSVPNYPTNVNIDHILQDKPRNIVFIIFDGLGYNYLNKYFAKSIFNQHIIDHVTSVYPCTTTAAIKSYMSGLAPSEHGWPGWSPYFKDEDIHVDLLPYRDAKTGMRPRFDYDLRDRLQFTSIFEKIHDASPHVLLHTNQIQSIQESFPCTIKHNYANLREMFSNIRDIIANKQENFIYCYHDNPDFLMHEFGPKSLEVQTCVSEIIEEFTLFYQSMRGQDVTVIISADHGQIDVGRTIPLYEDEEIMSQLITYPSVESRYTAFHLKDGVDHAAFSQLFLRKYGKEFFLMSRDELFKSGLLGPNEHHHPALDDFLGDYVALGKSDAIFACSADGYAMKGHHAGLLEDEMLVPIIAYKMKTAH